MTQKTLRCAVYTRKSSEEGLEQGFNSLHAQREACEAYVKSQAGEGWELIDTAYDDGGFSGGTMERPGLQRLLRDIAEGKIDIVVVYKVDRLTRSLSDFARMVEIFEASNVSFVSVTQAFNTTTSMGRLTLNVLLSFAQFEREVTGERIRDKIAASRKKGMWMGGNPPLGYDVRDRKLVVNEEEAVRVRGIYGRYIELGSVAELAADLKKEDIQSKSWRSGRGIQRGGKPFGRGALYALLRSRTYLGQVTHKGQVYEGEHPAVVPVEVWERVQETLMDHRRKPKARPTTKSRSLLAGLLFDDRGGAMSPAHARKRSGKRYRYYVSQAVIKGEPDEAGSVPRIPAQAIEDLVTERVRVLLPVPDRSRWEGMPPTDQISLLREAIRRVEVHAREVRLILSKKALDSGVSQAARERLGSGSVEETPKELTLRVPAHMKTWGGEKVILVPSEAHQPIKPRPDKALIKAIARAFSWRETLEKKEVKSIAALAGKAGQPERYFIRVLKLASLAPDIVEAILQGKQPPALTLTRLLEGDLPLSWADQRRKLGLFAQ